MLFFQLIHLTETDLTVSDWALSTEHYPAANVLFHLLFEMCSASLNHRFWFQHSPFIRGLSIRTAMLWGVSSCSFIAFTFVKTFHSEGVQWKHHDVWFSSSSSELLYPCACLFLKGFHKQRSWENFLKLQRKTKNWKFAVTGSIRFRLRAPKRRRY